MNGKVRLLFVSVFCCGMPVIGSADELNYELRVGLGYSDNVNREIEALAIDDSMALLGLNLEYLSQSRGFEVSVITDIDYLTYLDDTFDEEVLGAINADFSFNLIPNRFTWVVSDRFGQIQSNPFQAITEQNRETVNNLSTGFDLTLPASPRVAFEVSGRVSENTFEDANIDNQSIGGRLSLLRALSRTKTVSLNVTADRVQFDDSQANSNFDRQAAYVGFTSETSRSQLSVNLGYNELHDLGNNQDGSFVEVSLTRSLTPSLSTTIALEKRLTDTSNLFGDFQTPGLGFGDTQAVTALGEPFEVVRAEIGFFFNRQPTSSFAVIEFQDDDFTNSNNTDLTRLIFRTGFGWALGSAWRLTMGASLMRTSFIQVERDDDDLQISGGLEMRISEAIQLDLTVSRLNRSSTFTEFDFDENRAFLTLRYDR